MIKLIASDMDGTLLNDNQEISKDFEKVFKELDNKGIIFAAASGRPYYNLIDKFKEVKDDMLFIADNGAYVVYKNEELAVSKIDNKIIKELIKIGEKIEDSYIILCGKNNAYFNSDEERFLVEAKKYYNEYKIVKDLNEVNDDIVKFTICDLKGSEGNSYKYYDDYKDKLQVSVSGEIWLDIMDKGVNKGLAIKEIQDKLGISYEETMVFGDYLNDLEMMDQAYHSYAMENAHDDLKKVSRYIAKKNTEDGVIEKIKEVINIKL